MKLILLIALPLLVASWWDVGHMLTAAIAQIRLNKLDPYASVHFRDLVGSINQLCNNKSRTFIQSACWPDDIKGYPYYMKIWDSFHFKDSPYVMDTVVPIINYTQNALTSLIYLQTAHKVLTQNFDRNSAERALFARYVVHIVGDIHQPLHSVALFNMTYPNGDIGGNREKVVLINGSTSNFHSFWDAGAYRVQNDSWHIDRPMNLQNLTALKDVANGMIDEYGDQVQALGQIIDPAVWAQESFRIAQNTTYPYILETNQLNEEYTQMVYQTSRKRITLAGYRLANYIVELYKKADRKEGNLKGSDSLREKMRVVPVPEEKSKEQWSKWLAQDSWRAFRESPLRKFKNIMKIVSSDM